MKSEALIQTERRMCSFEPVVKDILALFYKDTDIGMITLELYLQEMLGIFSSTLACI